MHKFASVTQKTQVKGEHEHKENFPWLPKLPTQVKAFAITTASHF